MFVFLFLAEVEKTDMNIDEQKQPMTDLQSDNPALAEASQDGGISRSLDFVLKVIFILALAEMEERTKIDEQKKEKTDLLPDSTVHEVHFTEGMVKEFILTGTL